MLNIFDTRLSRLVQYHAFEDTMLFSLVETLSGHRLTAQESIQRGLMMRVLATRSNNVVQDFVAEQDANERRASQARVSGGSKRQASVSTAVTEGLMAPSLWGSGCDLVSAVQRVRAGAAAPDTAENEEKTVLRSLRAYFDCGDPMDRAREVAEENHGSRAVRQPSEAVRNAVFVEMMSAILSNALRPRPGKYVVAKKATFRIGEEISSEKAGKLQPGEAIMATAVREQPDGTFRVCFSRKIDAGSGSFWATGTTKDGEILIQRVPPPELTRDDCAIMKRSMLPAPEQLRRQRTLSSRNVARTVSSLTPTPRTVGPVSQLVHLCPEEKFEEPVSTVWWFTETADDGETQVEKTFSPQQCSALDRAYKSHAKSAKLKSDQVMFSASDTMMVLRRAHKPDAPVRRQPYHIPGHSPDEQKEWLHQNLMLQAMARSACRLGDIENRIMRLGQDQDPLYNRGAFAADGVSGYKYPDYKHETMIRLDEQAVRLKKRLQRFPFCGRLAIRLQRGLRFRPVEKWSKHAKLVCKVVVHTLASSQGGDGTQARSEQRSSAQPVDKVSGEVCWHDEELAFVLSSELVGVSVEIFQNDKHTNGEDRRVASVAIDMTPMAWCPYPWWRPVTVGVKCTNWNQCAGVVGSGSGGVGSSGSGSLSSRQARATAPTVAVLNIACQYSFTRVTPSSDTVASIQPPLPATRGTNDVDEGEDEELVPSKILQIATHALYDTIMPTEAGQREAVPWIVEEYGSMVGLTRATQGLVLLSGLLAHADLSPEWMADTATVGEGLVNATTSQQLLQDEMARFATMCESLSEMITECFVTFDVTFPIVAVQQEQQRGNEDGDGMLAAAVRLFIALAQSQGLAPATELADCLEGHVERLVQSICGDGSGGGGGGFRDPIQFRFLCGVVANELRELPVYAHALGPVLLRVRVQLIGHARNNM